MIKPILLFTLLLFSNSELCSQIVVVDENKNPIPYIDITISGQEALLWQTDRNGKIPGHVIKNADESDTLLLHHISFMDERIIIQDLKKIDTIFFKPFPYQIDEIEISSETPKYQNILASFRNIKIQNGHPVYYTDGKASYLTKTKNLKYKLSLEEYRAFENKEMNQFNNNYKTSIPMNTAYIPIPEEKYLPYQFVKKHDLTTNQKDTATIELLTEEGIVIGQIHRTQDVIEYKINNIFDIKKRKALNTEVDVTDFHIYMIFRNNTQEFELFDNFNLLIYSKIIYKHSLKHDKEKQKRNIETIEEIFVEDVKFTDEAIQEYTSSRGMPQESKYASKFWNKSECDYYYPQNNKIFNVMQMR